MRRTQSSPQPRYVPYAPIIGQPVPGALVPVPPPNVGVLHQRLLVPPPYNPHHRVLQPILVPPNRQFNQVVNRYCPPVGHLSNMNKFMAPFGQSITVRNETMTVRNKRPLDVVSQQKGTIEGGNTGSIKKSRRDYEPVSDLTKRKKPAPPPPPPLSQLFSKDNKTDTPINHKAKDKLNRYTCPSSPEEERLKLHIISVVKKLLRGKNLDKRLFKFICRHCSSNLFSILSAKKDISKPEKMIHMRMAKIARLVDEECEKIIEREKSMRDISIEEIR
jgi:hypothetical protein